MVSRPSILSSFAVPTQHNAPYFVQLQAPLSQNILSFLWLWLDSSLLPTLPGDGCLNVPGPGVITMGQFTLESLAPSVDHPGSFTVTLATVHSLAGQGHPGTPASGHRDTGLACLAGLSPSTDCYWHHTGQGCTDYWTPAPGTHRTHAGEVVVFCNIKAMLKRLRAPVLTLETKSEGESQNIYRAWQIKYDLILIYSIIFFVSNILTFKLL